MSLYNQEFNKDDVILRYVLLALLSDLKDRVYYYNRSDDNVKKIDIPFYYSITGGERFLLDNFLYDAEDEGKAIGDYEVVPRGILEMSSVSINSSELTNKFVRSEFVKQVSDKLKTFNLETNFIPINMSFDIKIICSNNLEILKVTESIISKLYKSSIYSVDLGMFRIESSYEIPDDFSHEKLFNFSINDKKEFSVSFPISVQTFIPVFENGILISEINSMIEDGDSGGIGIYLDGKINFGGIFNEFNTSLNDITLSETNDIQSNTQSINLKENKNKIYLIKDLRGDTGSEEDDESKNYRNKQE